MKKVFAFMLMLACFATAIPSYAAPVALFSDSGCVISAGKNTFAAIYENGKPLIIKKSDNDGKITIPNADLLRRCDFKLFYTDGRLIPQKEAEEPVKVVYFESGINSVSVTYKYDESGKERQKYLRPEKGTQCAAFNCVQNTDYLIEIEGEHSRFRFYGKNDVMDISEESFGGEMWMDGIIADEKTDTEIDKKSSYTINSGNYNTIIVYFCQKNYKPGQNTLKITQLTNKDKKPAQSNAIVPREDIPYWTPAPVTDGPELADGDYYNLLDKVYEPLRKAYPDYISRQIIGQDETETYDIYAYTFEPEHYEQTCYLSSGVHPREVDSWIALGLFMREICKNTTNCPEIDYLRNNVKMIVVPVVNVWGVSQPRDKRHDVNVNGKNLNRDTLDKTQRESRVMTAFIDKILNELSFAIDCHTTVTNGYGDYMLTAYEGTKNEIIAKRTSYYFAKKNAPERLPEYLTKRNIKNGVLRLNNFGESFLRGTYTNYFYTKGVPSATVEHSDYVWDTALATEKTLYKALEIIGNQIIQHALNKIKR